MNTAATPLRARAPSLAPTLAALGRRVSASPLPRLILGFGSMAGFVIAGLGLWGGWLGLPTASAIGALALAGYALALIDAS
jgi:hypothetical protein